MITDHPLSLLLRDFERAEKGIRTGLSKEKIAEKFPDFSPDDFDEFYDIARARVRNNKTEIPLIYSQSDLRFGTPDIVAFYRAKRLACDVLVDVCSGVGMQTLQFAKTCKKVIGIELDPRKVAYAKLNALLTKTENVEFICADALGEKAIELIKSLKPDVVFCDPERLPSEKERMYANILPSMPKLVELYKPLAKNIVIEFPPQMKVEQIPHDGEFEYLSLDGRVNRLDLYMGPLASEKKSVVVLPSEKRLTPQKHTMIEQVIPCKYFLEVDPTILKANMLGDLLTVLHEQDDSIGLCYEEKDRCVLTSKKKVKSPFLRNVFLIETTTQDEDESIITALNEVGATDVMLRLKVDPREYWKRRNTFEKALTAKRPRKVIHLFSNRGSMYLCTKC